MIESTDFLKVTREDFDYLFFLIANKYWRHREVNPSLDYLRVFAKTGLGPHGKVAISDPAYQEKNNEQVLAKAWPEDIRRQLQSQDHPKLLVIENDFAAFDAHRDRFALIDFAAYGGATSAIEKILRAIERVIRDREDFFQWWEQNAMEFRVSPEQLRAIADANLNNGVPENWRHLETVLQTQAARILDKTEKTVRNYIKAGKLQVAANRRVRVLSLIDFLDNRNRG